MNPISKISAFIHRKKLIHRTINYVRNRIPFAHTLNHKYDLQTLEVIKKVCQTDSNCIDVGCFKGDIMDFYLKYVPNGTHFGFEPIPSFYDRLVKKYQKGECILHNVALSDRAGTVEFNYVVSDPGYSGFKERTYRTDHELIDKIKVKADTLDHIIPDDIKIDLIKIDVEGGEFLVLQGAKALIKRCQPIIVFEFEKGAAGHYGTQPEDIFNLFEQLNMKVSLMERFLKSKPSLSVHEFKHQFDTKENYYFIAYPSTFEL